MSKIINLSPLAEKFGFRLGDDVIEMGGHPFCDVLDFLYFDNEKKFDAVVLRDGKSKKIKVRKKDGETLGLEFEEMEVIRCKNKCVFCFVDQLPKGLRDTLYVKDDDYRLSFISGCYVTMTNVKEEDVERIIRLKLSPLYISVHAFDDDKRVELVKNPNTRNLINLMRRLGENGIEMHTQLVIVPEMNDGATLIESIDGLHSVKGVQTVAVVPVGITGHRNGLTNIRPVTKEEANETIDHVEWLNQKYGGDFCWCSDEYYLKAERELPDFTFYGNFDQIENGVGLVADFVDNLDYALGEVEDKHFEGKVTMITGTSFAPVLNKEKTKIESKLGLNVSVKGILNTFFGESVTVAGLVTGGDILAQAKDDDTDVYVIPDNMLREFTTTFLDDTTVDELVQKLEKPVLVVAHNGTDVVNKLVEFFEEK
jgi:putative radical SAM enzyme (TIGR03279 family)